MSTSGQAAEDRGNRRGIPERLTVAVNEIFK